MEDPKKNPRSHATLSPLARKSQEEPQHRRTTKTLPLHHHIRNPPPWQTPTMLHRPPRTHRMRIRACIPHDTIYSSTAQCIILEDIHENSGHILIHYLCTDEYEAHYKRSDGPEQYRHSVLAYVAARNLSLGELESLAIAHMERYENDVDIFQILTAALEESDTTEDETTEDEDSAFEWHGEKIQCCE